MEAWVWPSDWGLASINPRCLQMMTYAKFSGAPLLVHESGNPFWTPQSDLPVVRQQNQDISTFPAFVSHLREHNYSADYNLTAKQKAEIIAFTQLMEERLYPALLYVFWLDAKNLAELTRPWYAKQMPIPLGLYYPPKYQKHAANVVEGRFGIPFIEGDLSSVSMLETAVYKNAEECLTMMSKRLGDATYLFGQAPSSADALLYGFLAPLLKAPFPNPTLQNHLKACENLVKFVGRISTQFFSKVALEYEKKNKGKKKPKASSTNSNDDGSSKSDPSNKDEAEEYDMTRPVVAGCVAATAMFGYAYASGLIDIVRNIEIVSYENEDDEEEENE